MTHELKTPLQSIIGSAELLETGLVKPEDTARFVGNIRKEASRLVKQYGLQSPTDAVYDGTWTMDLVYEMMRAVANDTNGDGSMGEADTWGYITGIGDINALMIAADRHYITLDSNGEMQLKYSSEPV